MGNERGKSLSPELAEKYFNYFEVVFAENKGGPIDGDTPIYRAAGFTGQTVKISVPEGLYDNDGANTAIMMAGARNITTGETTLLATGVIVAHEGGGGSEPAAQIGLQTTRVIFKLTALTAEIKPAADSAFTIPASPNNYGKTCIDGAEYVYFNINTSVTNGGITDAELTLTGWEGSTPTGNNTKRFIRLVHSGAEEFGLAGIGVRTDDGDGPLPSTANVKWKIDNLPELLGPTDPIKIQFTSNSGVDVSGMAWLPIRVPVKAFTDVSGAQVWYVGSGILRDKLDAKTISEAAVIMILHGDKIFNPGIGTGQGGMFEHTLDLAAATGTSLAGWWTFSGNTYTLVGGKPNGLVRIKGDTTERSIVVPDNVKVNVLLDGMTIELSDDRIPFELKSGSEATVYLSDSTENTLKAFSGGTKAALVNTGATLTIKGHTGKIAAKGGPGSAGIGGSAGASGGTITIEGGIVLAEGVDGGAGIGGGYDSGTGGDGGTITIKGGTVIAKGSTNTGNGSAGIGGGAGATTGGAGGGITINGGVVIAEGGDDGAGIGGGGGISPGDGGTIALDGGTVYASATGFSGKGIGAAGTGTTSTITCSTGAQLVIFASSADGGLNHTPGSAIFVDSAKIDLGSLVFSFPGFPSNNSLAITAKDDMIVPLGATFTIPPYVTFTHGAAAQTLVNNGTLVIDGTLVLYDSNSTLTNNGAVRQSGIYTNNGGSQVNGNWTVIP
jgi:hypothetical protein